jgi:hypothetical protein
MIWYGMSEDAEIQSIKATLSSLKTSSDAHASAIAAVPAGVCYRLHHYITLHYIIHHAILHVNHMNKRMNEWIWFGVWVWVTVGQVIGRIGISIKQS